MRNNILITGSRASWAIETYYAKYLNQQGFEVSIFECSKYFNHSSILNKVRYRIGDQSIYREANKALVQYCIKHRPHIVWIFKGVEIYSETLKAIKDLGIILANYNPDHPFIRTSIAHGGRNIPESIPLYDLYFTYSKLLKEKISNEYSIKTVWLPFGFELSEDEYNLINREKEINKACFIGTPDRERVEILTQISKSGIPIDIFGQHYQDKYKLRLQKNIELNNVVLNLEFWKKIRQYRVQLNFFRPHNIGSHNQRTFEVPGAGGILLTPDSIEQREFFQADNEIFFYNNEYSLPGIISKIMSKSEKDINKIRQSARQRSIDSAYSYKGRSAMVFEVFRSYLS